MKFIECGAEFLPKGNGTFILVKVDIYQKKEIEKINDSQEQLLIKIELKGTNMNFIRK